MTTSARSSPASMRFATKRSLFSRTSSGGLDDAEPPGRRPSERDRRRDAGERNPARRYVSAGLDVHWISRDPERANLVVSGTRGGGRSLALNAHVDTVAPVEPDAWLCGSPWNPEIRDGRLYGLGSTDKGASGAAGGRPGAHDEGVELDGDLHLHSVVGEEMMEHPLGTTALLEEAFAPTPPS